MMNDHDIEVHVERLSAIITSKTAEFWEERNRALLELTAVLSDYPKSRIHSAFKTEVLKLLVQPVKELVMDLRSQQVRDTCAFLTKLSEILEEENVMKVFMRDVFDSIFLALKAPHKVISGYVDECILSVLRNTTFKSAVHTIVSEIKESKSKHMRERSMDYLGEILKYWELSDRELDGVCDAISLGLEDASAKAREFARVAYMQLKTKYSKRADRLKAHLQVPIRAKLAKMEDEHDAAEQKKMMSSAQSVRCEEPVEPKAPPEVAISAVVALQALVRGSITRQSMSASDLTQERKPVASAAASLFRRVAVTEDHHGSQTAAVVPHIHKTIVPPSSHIKPNSAQAPHSNDHVNSSSSLVIPHINTSVALTSTQPPSTSPLYDVPTVGMNVGVVVDGRKVYGVVKFFGETSFAPGQWVGIQLDTPDGKNDGTVKGQRYFTCPMFFGLFSKPGALTVETVDNNELLRATSSMSERGGLVDTKALCSILKIKIAKSIELLSADMAIAEQLEMPENFKLDLEEYEKLLVNLSETADEGANHLHTFKNDIERLNSF